MPRWSAGFSRHVRTVGVVLGLSTMLATSPSFAATKTDLTLQRFLTEHGLRITVTRQKSWTGPIRYAARLAHSSKSVEMKDRRESGTLISIYGKGETRIGAVNHLLFQIGGKHLVLNAYSRGREEHSIPGDFKVVKKLPAGTEKIDE